MLFLPESSPSPRPPPGYRPCTSFPVHWFCDDGWGARSLRLDSSSKKFLNWLLDHKCPGWNRTVEVGTLRASPERAIEVVVLGCLWEGSGPGQPHAHLPRVASRSLARACGSIPCSTTAERKVLPCEVM